MNNGSMNPSAKGISRANKTPIHISKERVARAPLPNTSHRSSIVRLSSGRGVSTLRGSTNFTKRPSVEFKSCSPFDESFPQHFVMKSGIDKWFLAFSPFDSRFPGHYSTIKKQDPKKSEEVEFTTYSPFDKRFPNYVGLSYKRYKPSKTDIKRRNRAAAIKAYALEKGAIWERRHLVNVDKLKTIASDRAKNVQPERFFTTTSPFDDDFARVCQLNKKKPVVKCEVLSKPMPQTSAVPYSSSVNGLPMSKIFMAQSIPVQAFPAFSPLHRQAHGAPSKYVLSNPFTSQFVSSPAAVPDYFASLSGIAHLRKSS